MKVLLYSTITLLLTCVASKALSQNLSKAQETLVLAFIENVKNEKWNSLSESVAYPLKRQYPIPPVTKKEDFMARHAQIFDAHLIALITNSNVQTDWSESDSKGISFNDGQIWLNEEGKLATCTYQSKEEEQLELELIQADKDTLPASLKDFDRPILQMKSSQFLLRIDQLEDASYRFAWWLSASPSNGEEPTEIIQNGVLEQRENEQDQTYTYESKIGTIVCVVSGSNSSNRAPAQVRIYRDGELLRTYNASVNN